MKQLHLGIIIVSWNVREYLNKCLDSIKSAVVTDTTEDILASTPPVIVIDNASHDGSAEMVRINHPWVKLSTLADNLGYVKANNIAITSLLKDHSPSPDVIWLLNPDTIVNRPAIIDLVNFFAANPRAGLIGPKLLNPDGSLQESAFKFPGFLQPLFDFGILPRRFYFTALNGRYSETKYTSKSPFKIDHPLGAGMMVRVQTIEEVGLLDKGFFMYCEEIDWSWRMKKSGWERWLVPSAAITHFGGASTSQVKPATTAYLWESRARLYSKHHSQLIFRLTAFLVKRHFSKQTEQSVEWMTTYQRIISAWQSKTIYAAEESPK